MMVLKNLNVIGENNNLKSVSWNNYLLKKSNL